MCKSHLQIIDIKLPFFLHEPSLLLDLPNRSHKNAPIVAAAAIPTAAAAYPPATSVNEVCPGESSSLSDPFSGKNPSVLFRCEFRERECKLAVDLSSSVTRIII